MKRTFIRSFLELPFTELSENSVRSSQPKKSLFSQIVVDILDDELWGSKVSILGNALIILAILLSTMDYILSNGAGGYLISNNPLKFVIAGFFLIEFVLRISYAKALEYAPSATRSYLF